MREAEFNETENNVTRIIEHNLTDGWYPTTEQLASRNIPGHAAKEDEYASFILFFASNPYKDNKDPEYLNTVKYCRSVSVKIPIEP